MPNDYQYLQINDPDNHLRSRQLSINDVATICKVSEKTAKRWISGDQQPHPSCSRLLELYAFGIVPLLQPGAFKNVRFKPRGYGKNEEIPVMVTCDVNYELSATDINYYQERLSRNYDLQCQYDRLSNELEQLKTNYQKTQQQDRTNVIAFAPHLRRKEQYHDQRA